MKKLLIASADTAEKDLSLLFSCFSEGDVLIAGCESEKMTLPGAVGRLYTMARAAGAAEEFALAQAAAELFQSEKYELLCFACSGELKAAALMTASFIKAEVFPDVLSLNEEGECLKLRRRVYGSNIEAEFQVQGPAVLSLAEKKTAAVPMNKEYPALKLDVKRADWLISSEFTEYEQDKGLKNAKILFAAGKGIGSRENYERLRALARSCGAACGATRALVLSGWADTDEMIGQSGSICAPELCICFGASGAAPFLIGVEQADKLVAINTDPSASVFKAADYGLIADCRQILSSLEALIRK